jgi:hypothetical protein
MVGFQSVPHGLSSSGRQNDFENRDWQAIRRQQQIQKTTEPPLITAVLVSLPE